MTAAANRLALLAWLRTREWVAWPDLPGGTRRHDLRVLVAQGLVEHRVSGEGLWWQRRSEWRAR